MSEAIENATDETYKDIVLKSDIPVLVDFWAPWCGPCRVVGPILESLATEYQGRVKIVKVNVDDNNQLAASMGIQSIPTMMLYQNGKVIQTVVGSKPKGELITLLDSAL